MTTEASYNPRKNPNGDINSPDEFNKLPEQEQEAALKAIRKIIEPGPRILRGYTTYGLKHLLQDLYITNGAMKGACIAAGFRIEDKSKINWRLYATFTEEGAEIAKRQ